MAERQLRKRRATEEEYKEEEPGKQEEEAEEKAAMEVDSETKGGTGKAFEGFAIKWPKTHEQGMESKDSPDDKEERAKQKRKQR